MPESKDKIAIPKWLLTFIPVAILVIGSFFVNDYKLKELQKDVDAIGNVERIHALELKIKDLENDIKILQLGVRNQPTTAGLGISR